MNLTELQQRAHSENERLRQSFPDLADRRLHVLAQLAKLTEETGELADEILAHYRLQRAAKLKDPQEHGLEKELGDVLFVAAMLADNLDIDLAKILDERTTFVKSRKYAE